MQAVLPPFPVGKKAPLQEKRSVIYWRKPTGQRGDTAVAKDFMDLLRFRSKKQQKKEMEAYAAWAFPHGPRQQEKVRALLAQLLPGEDTTIAMVIFLLGKEAFWDKDGRWEDEEREPVQDAARALRRSGMRVKAQDIPLYLALILADSRVDGELSYPTAEALREMAGSLM